MQLKGLGKQAARAEAKQGCNGKQSLIFLLLGHSVAPRATYTSEAAASSGAWSCVCLHAPLLLVMS